MTEQEKRRVGRPTDAPKGKPITVRFTDEESIILDGYAAEKCISKAEAIRHGVQKLKEK